MIAEAALSGAAAFLRKFLSFLAWGKHIGILVAESSPGSHVSQSFDCIQEV